MLDPIDDGINIIQQIGDEYDKPSPHLKLSKLMHGFPMLEGLPNVAECMC